ncbi:MAG: hypothetical protein A2Z83_02675 [Omnitrophica bacterium GWA2_52_8]|nr:MAG: hypothetical protein A2Z83_02675 [Omnitrophica bacterium GWA2_52_8]
MDLSVDPGLTAFNIVQRLTAHGHKAFFAGGSVRDEIMGCKPQDIDIATSALPGDVEKLFKKTIPVGRKFGVVLVVENGRTYEVATFRSEGNYEDGRHPKDVAFTHVTEDARRRDFTINGLYYEPVTHKVLDYVDGVPDIKTKTVRAIGDAATRFNEDKLRLLRAVRFAANLNFTIESVTWDALKERSREILQVSAERIRDELIKIFTRKGAARGFQLLSDSGLMKEILPEIEAMKGVEQPSDYHPEGDVFVHTKLLLQKMEELPQTNLVLAFGALFHDIAKPVTAAVRKGRITFYEHAPIGAKMTEAIMKRLRFSNDEVRAVVEAVGNHMKFGDVKKMRAGKLKRFVARDNFQNEMILHKIDCQASHGNLENYQFLKNKIDEYEDENLRPEPFIDGHDALKLGITPGPAIKRILEKMYDLQLEGQFHGRDEALNYLKSKLAEFLDS